jgi:hypothetical protein
MTKLKPMRTLKKPSNTLVSKRLLPLAGSLRIVFKFYGEHSPRGKKVQATATSYNVSKNIDEMIKNAFFNAESKYLHGYVQEQKSKLLFIQNFSDAIDEGLYDDVVVSDYDIYYYEYDQSVKRIRRKNKYYNNIYTRGKLSNVVQEKQLTKRRINRNEFVQGINEEDTDLKTKKHRVYPESKRSNPKYIKTKNIINKESEGLE